MKLSRFLSLQPDYSLFTLVGPEEKIQAVKMRPSASFWKDGFKRLFKNPIAIICITVLALIILAAIFIPMFWPYSYDEMLGTNRYYSTDAYKVWESLDPLNNDSFAYIKPFEHSEYEKYLISQGESVFPHVLGTDSAGRDYFIRIIYGMRISLVVGFFASVIVCIIGTIYGAISGYFGGKVDMIMMRIVDVIYSLPDLLIIILLSVVLNATLKDAIAGTIFEKLGYGIISIFIVYGLLYWVGMARMVRGQIMAIKKQEFVLAARTIGTSSMKIIFKHLLPNCIGIIIVTTALQIPSAIFTESFLSFVGLGVSVPMPSLGSLASEASKLSVMISYTYMMIISSLSILFIVLSLNLLGDALRDAFDPKLRK